MATILVLAAACTPEPPAPPAPAPPAPAPPAPAPITLPGAPVGASAAPLDPADAPDPFVLSVEPQHCAPEPTPEPTPATTTTSTTTTTTTEPTTVVTSADPPSTTTTVETPTTTSSTTTTTTTAPPPPLPGGCYFAYTTQFGIALVPVWRSADLVTWTPVWNTRVQANAMPALAPWTEFGFHWAPSVLHRPGNPADEQYVMWYTAREKASGLQCLGVATSQFPEGPFVDRSTQPAFCQRSLGGTIDASPFVDDDGTAYLAYKSESPAKLWVSRLSPNGMSVVAGTERFLWEAWSVSDDPVVEAPTLVRVNGKVLLFYSTGDWSTSRYRVGVAQCDAVTGPCFAKYSTSVLASRGSMLGPGGQTPFRDADGGWRMMFHAWTSTVGYPAGARSLHILPITFSGYDVRVG